MNVLASMQKVPGSMVLIPPLIGTLINTIDFKAPPYIVKKGGTLLIVKLLIGGIAVTGTTLFLADKLTGGNGIAGLASSSMADNAAGAQTTILVAAPAMVSAIAVSVITAANAQRVAQRGLPNISKDAADVVAASAPASTTR